MTQLTKLVCWFCGHDWEALRTFGLNVSPLGHGLMRHKKCRRCGKEYDYIIIEHLDGAGLEASVMNRVEKAAGGKSV